jgi:hypothetical protein
VPCRSTATTQEKYASQMLAAYKAAGIPASDVFAEF